MTTVYSSHIETSLNQPSILLAVLELSLHTINYIKVDVCLILDIYVAPVKNFTGLEVFTAHDSEFKYYYKRNILKDYLRYRCKCSSYLKTEILVKERFVLQHENTATGIEEESVYLLWRNSGYILLNMKNPLLFPGLYVEAVVHSL